MPSAVLVTFVVVSLALARSTPYHHVYPGGLHPLAFDEPHHRRHALRLSQIAEQNLAGSTLGHVVSPVAFGGDPDGRRDATEAMKAAVQNLLSLGGGRKDAKGRVDLGGAVLDLAGGVFSISSTILVPPGFSNFRIQRGTLLARANFTGEGYMLQVGSKGGCNATSHPNCNSDVSISQMTLDGGDQFAFGGLLVEDTMNVNIGPAIMVVGFRGVGISLAGSGAGFVHEAWLGQFPDGDKQHKRDEATATAILLDSGQHDCDVNNVIVFSGLVGVNSTNGANRLQGVHTWNLSGKQGGTGIRLHGGTGRVQQSYLDYAPLVIAVKGVKGKPWQKPASLTMVEGNLFLGSSTIVLEAHASTTVVSGLQVTGNDFHTFNSINSTFTLDETLGAFVAVQNTVIENNEVGPKIEASGGRRSTRATKSATVAPGKDSVELDFGSALLFSPRIGIAAVSCSLSGRHPTAVSTETSGNQVKVFLAAAVPAEQHGVAVTCTVDQSTRTCAAH